MRAGVALLDMAAQCRRAAELDGAHDPQLGTAKHAGMRLAILRAVAAEHVRHLQLHAAHGPRSGSRQGQVEAVERTGDGADRAGGDVQVARSGGQAAMAEQQLDGAQVGAGFEQVGGAAKGSACEARGMLRRGRSCAAACAW